MGGRPGTSTGRRLLPSGTVDRDGESFHLDPRLPADQQTSDAAYSSNRLDRGHVARRSALLWGTIAEARTANTDSFSFTNITPQMDDFNESSLHGSWGLLENAVLAQDGLTDRRLSVLGGPVLRETDPPYRGLVQVPREFWKVVVYRMAGELRFRAFILTQDLDLGTETFLEDFKTYQVSLYMLETRTRLTFAGLEDVDPDPLAPRVPMLLEDATTMTW